MPKDLGFLHFIDSINEWVGRVVSFFVLAIIGIVIYEVLMRYIFIRSQVWVPEMSIFLFGGLFILGGGYAYRQGGHVTLDLLYNRFSPKGKALLDLITSIFSFLFLGVIIWKGWLIAWDSLITYEKSASAFAPPLFPIKLCLPLGGVLFMLQVIAKWIRDLLTVMRGGKDEY